MAKMIDVDKIPAEAFDKMKARAAERGDPIDNTRLVLDFRKEGGAVMHIRPRPRYNGVTRGLTVAFKNKNGRIEIATSVQHRADDFTKKIGTKTAIEHFKAGKTVTLPVRGDYATQRLQDALSILV